MISHLTFDNFGDDDDDRVSSKLGVIGCGLKRLIIVNTTSLTLGEEDSIGILVVSFNSRECPVDIPVIQ